MVRPSMVLPLLILVLEIGAVWPEEPADRPSSVVAAPGRHGIIDFSKQQDTTAGKREFVHVGAAHHPSMPRIMKVRLNAAFRLAVDRLVESPDCGDLFSALGADGVVTLKKSIYLTATAQMELSLCRQSLAGTGVGNRTVFLCRRFSGLPVEKAAVVLLHEALHTAGLSERPLDPGGMAPEEISTMVRTSCDSGHRRALPPAPGQWKSRRVEK